MTRFLFFFFFSSRRRHTRLQGDWSSDVCSSDLHSNQADAELVFQQLAHRTDTAVSEMVDVVDLPDILAKFEQVFDDSIEVRRLEDPLVKRRCQVQLDIEFQASDSREVILA